MTIDNTLPFHALAMYSSLWYLSKSVNKMIEMFVKIINYFRQIMIVNADYFATNNPWNTISYLCAVIRMIYNESTVTLLCSLNGQTCEFCFICWLDSLDTTFGVFASQTCLEYESGLDFIQMFYLKRKPFFNQSRTWFTKSGHINTIFLWIRGDVLFFWISNCEDSMNKMVGLLLN